MLVLGLETSCDETGIAIYCGDRGLLAHRVYSQVAIHADYGGVVPELASRDHVRKTLPLLQEVLAEAGLAPSDLDGIAYTAGPGLVGALLVGAAVARGLAWSLGIPALGIHHMEGHLLAPMLEPDPPPIPFVALLVSGGHTQLVHVHAIGEYELLGESLDDAVGEAFDKTATLLQLGYPGGPALERLAANGRPNRYQFPRPMTNRPGLDFSFSGIKTFAANTIRDALAQSDDNEQTRADIAHAFMHAVVDTLVIKCRRALRATGAKHLIAAGGVSANKLLRARLKDLGEAEQVAVYYPRPEFCTDNGAMIAYAGHARLQAGEADSPAIRVHPRWSLEELAPSA